MRLKTDLVQMRKYQLFTLPALLVIGELLMFGDGKVK